MKVVIRFVAFSVTVSVRPRGSKPIWAGPTSGPLSDRVESGSGAIRPLRLSRKPAMFAGVAPSPAFST